jgi:hypothetical protein
MYSRWFQRAPLPVPFVPPKTPRPCHCSEAGSSGQTQLPSTPEGTQGKRGFVSTSRSIVLQIVSPSYDNAFSAPPLGQSGLQAFSTLCILCAGWNLVRTRADRRERRNQQQVVKALVIGRVIPRIATSADSNIIATTSSKRSSLRSYAVFFSTASIAENLRSMCGSERGAPECTTQRSRMRAPQVGQRTEDICLGVRSLLFKQT